MTDHLLPRGLPGGVARRCMTEFVRQHGGKFRFVVGKPQHTGIHKNKSARQCKRVDFFRVDQREGNGKSDIGITHQILPQAVDVFRDNRIVNDPRLLLDFDGKLLAESDFLFEAVEVRPARYIASPMASGLSSYRPRPGRGQDSDNRQASGSASS